MNSVTISLEKYSAGKGDEDTKPVSNTYTKMELIHLFIDNTPIAYCVLDREYRIVYYNKRYAEVRSGGSAIPLGIRCYDLIAGGKRCSNCAVRVAICTKEKAFISRKDLLANGSCLFVDDYAVPLQLDAAGEVEYVLEIMVDRSEEMRVKEQNNVNYDEMLALLSSLLESKDTYTAAHSDSVRRLSVALAKQMRLPPEEIFLVSVAASLHDIGKICIPGSIINKHGVLTEEEYTLIKQHPAASCEMLDGLSCFGHIRKMILHHHERVDGKGYPDGLCGDALPMGSKIIAVADTYDAITSNRSYRPAQSHRAALRELRRVAGTQLDSDVVSAFFSIDFMHLDDTLYPEKRKGENHIVRQVPQPAPVEPVGFSTQISNFDREALVGRVLDNTPCGYVFTDRQGRVLFASEYFFTYMGFKREDIMSESYRYDYLKTVSPLDFARTHGTIEQRRLKRHVGGETKVFDYYSVPAVGADGEAAYFIGMVIDRAEEVRIEQAWQQDMIKLATTISGVLEEQKGEVDASKIYSQIGSFIGRMNSQAP